jgi:hypothetical protein
VGLNRPPGFDEFAAHLDASDAPAVVLIDRELMRALLRYVRTLEREIADAGSFW